MLSTLKPSNNSKVRFIPNHNNTFGLTHGSPKNGGTCIGATCGPGGCLDIRDGLKRQTCYVSKIVQIYKNVGKVLTSNSELLVGKTQPEMTELLIRTFQTFKDNNKKENWYYRLHWAGDFFSEDYARAMVEACSTFPEIRFWVYTRSFDFVPILVEASNLAVYLSLDPVNKDKGLKIYEELRYRYNNVGVAFMGPRDVTNIKFINCPETHGKIENTKDKGACAKCKLCFTYTDKIQLRNIAFSLH
jgi:hypothetical protein